ncbi:MAG TPA: HAD family phosphatase [Magnetospirillaceae bacterium]|nr:HAD family phosphatase [Magnetospirillaceae bacterium]
MVQAIIFDFFGVIRTDALKSWLTFHNFEPNDEMRTAIKQVDRGDISADQFFAMLGKISGQTPAEILHEMEHGAALDYHILELIKQLKPKYKIGLLSNASSAFIRTILREYQLDPYFDTVVVSSEVGLIKPEPAIFKLALKQLDVPPEQTVFIDDSPANVAGAKDVGIRSMIYTTSQALRNDLTALGITFD